jgi:hypothetical protein
MDVDTRRALEDHVLDADAYDFRNARSGVIEESKQSVVALSDPACRLWSVKHGLHLLLREKPQHRFFETLDGDSQRLLDNVKHGDVVVSCVLQKAPESCQAGIAATGCVVPLVL